MVWKIKTSWIKYCSSTEQPDTLISLHPLFFPDLKKWKCCYQLFSKNCHFISMNKVLIWNDLPWNQVVCCCFCLKWFNFIWRFNFFGNQIFFFISLVNGSLFYERKTEIEKFFKWMQIQIQGNKKILLY